MKAFLMYKDQDFNLEQQLPWNEGALTQDLELNTLWNAMAGGDTFLFTVVKSAILSSLDDPEAITYRQQVLADCLAQPATVRQLYALTVEFLQAERKIWGLFGHYSASALLQRAIEVVELAVPFLKRLRTTAAEEAGNFHSEGFTRFFAMLTAELDDEYFQRIEGHLRELKFRRGVLMSAGLGRGNKGTQYVLRRPPEQTWLERLTSATGHTSYSFTIAERDEAGYQALDALRSQGINLVANALTQATDHILDFFRMLRTELAFYVGCLNLHSVLREKGEPVCFPVPLAANERAHTAQGLYDACLSLRLNERVIGNDLNADGKSLVIITGANQGGKSTFLRGIGVAQLMMQSGMFAPAESFRANVCRGVFTHYKREEDPTMKSGKLDEELSRMSIIADRITPHALLLCNESFAATNDREGSEIARQVIRALIEADIKVFFVTHLYDLAHGYYIQHPHTALFLRAERQADGQRTFRLVEGEPLPTSYGVDTYQRIFQPLSSRVGHMPQS